MVLTSLGGALISAGTSLANGFGQMFGQQSANYKMRQHQTSERIASQQWQDQQRRDQNQYAEDMYLKYQSPEALVRQYQAAGLNPRLAVGETGQISASSGSSGSAPTGGSVPLGNPWSSSLPQGFADVASAFAALAQAKKAGVDTRLTELNVKAQEIRNAILKVDAEIAEKFAAKKVSAEIDKIAQDIETGKATEAQLRASVKLIGKKADLTQQEIDSFWINVQNQFDLARALTRQSDTQSDLNEAKVKTEGTVQAVNTAEVANKRQIYRLNEFRAMVEDDKANRFENSYEFRQWVIDEVNETIRVGGLMPQAQLDQINQSIKLLMQDNHYYEARMLLQTLIGLAMPAAVATK
ncbi:DNA pilot protein [Sigmofec virus UA08Rod_4258]|uniref:DNA pilot protein n=1 Tax=Sigmofec virus UA08Rod_4258 TaxID=2929397 RepID=A0A976R5D4_9VIRU|nr:DNA pilot protein [Sigmofec virus UA08Rod_4258]